MIRFVRTRAGELLARPGYLGVYVILKTIMVLLLVLALAGSGTRDVVYQGF